MLSIKRVAAINDLSGYGKRSLTIAIPIISSMNIEVCPLPTAVLSTHTGFTGFNFLDLAETMEKTIEHWKRLKLKFSCIYSGFLGSEIQIDLVLDFIKYFGSKALKLIDPVMGDNGETYRTYTSSMCQSMKKLVAVADIITPNLTEAAILLDKCYPKYGISEEQIKSWLRRLCDLGPRYSVITGVEIGGKIYNFAYDKINDLDFSYKNKKIAVVLSGTGDLFASVLCGALLNNFPLSIALEISSNFVYSAILYTVKSGSKANDGLQFENLLHILSSNLPK